MGRNPGRRRKAAPTQARDAGPLEDGRYASFDYRSRDLDLSTVRARWTGDFWFSQRFSVSRMILRPKEAKSARVAAGLEFAVRRKSRKAWGCCVPTARMPRP